jgi:hypothetical protein
MIASQIGEHRDVDASTVEASFGDADRTRLERTRLGFVRRQSREVAHQCRRLGRREAGLDQLTRQTGAQRANDRAAAGGSCRSTA